MPLSNSQPGEASLQPGYQGDGADTMLVLTMRDEIRICLPASLHRMTTYVILEQEDWFEDEIAFVRVLLKPGMKVADIGANYGVYTLTMARLVGHAATVWAFEPATATAQRLRASIELNRFPHVRLVQKALSNRAGAGTLSLRPNAELNSLSVPLDGAGESETVELATLDDCAREFDWSGLEFIKLDAEGEEHNIVQGGRDFLGRESPLIMFELKHWETVNLALISQFATLGYDTYRLVPGLNLLVPFHQEGTPDSYLLNLFCCKPDRAAELEVRGLLVRGHDGGESSGTVRARGIWREFIGARPYAAALIRHWLAGDAMPPAPGREQYLEGLDCYALAHSTQTTARARYAWLQEACQKAGAALALAANHPRLQTYIRITRELGLRDQALGALNQLFGMFKPNQPVVASEPFLAMIKRFENIDPEDRLDQWCLSSMLELHQKLIRFSSFFMNTEISGILKNIEAMRHMGFLGAEMERRRQLIRLRHGLQSGPEPCPLLAQKTAENLNPAYWTTGNAGSGSMTGA